MFRKNREQQQTIIYSQDVLPTIVDRPAFKVSEASWINALDSMLEKDANGYLPSAENISLILRWQPLKIPNEYRKTQLENGKQNPLHHGLSNLLAILNREYPDHPDRLRQLDETIERTFAIEEQSLKSLYRATMNDLLSNLTRAVQLIDYDVVVKAVEHSQKDNMYGPAYVIKDLTKDFSQIKIDGSEYLTGLVKKKAALKIIQHPAKAKREVGYAKKEAYAIGKKVAAQGSIAAEEYIKNLGAADSYADKTQYLR